MIMSESISVIFRRSVSHAFWDGQGLAGIPPGKEGTYFLGAYSTYDDDWIVTGCSSAACGTGWYLLM